MKKHFVYEGSAIHYNTYGSGQNILVLLHGFGEDSRIFDQQVSFLKDEYTLIIPDLPGSGKSALMLTKSEITMYDYAGCIKSLLDHEGIAICILLGHSMGGYITLAFAEKYPGMLLAFGLIHSGATADTNEKKKSRLQGIEMIKRHGALSFLKNTTPNLFADSFKKTNASVVEQLILQNISFTSEALIQYYTSMMNRKDTTSVLANAAVPVLFVLGKEDTAAPLEIVIKQVQLPFNTHIHILDNVAHMSMLEAPGKLNGFIHEFAQYAIDHKD